jgi:hypothetical protein
VNPNRPCVEAEPVDWLWAGRIARGKLTLIAGDPGMGKSQIALDVVARISKGARSPDGNTTPTGSALSAPVLTAEDAAKDTVRPRLEAARSLDVSPDRCSTPASAAIGTVTASACAELRRSAEAV